MKNAGICLLLLAMACGSGSHPKGTTSNTAGAPSLTESAGMGGREANEANDAGGAGGADAALGASGGDVAGGAEALPGGAAGSFANEAAGAAGAPEMPWTGERIELPIGPFGDSITAGHGSSTGNGWRRYPNDQAAATAYPIKWFGISAGGDFPNPRHTGISNATIERCSQAVSDYLAPGKRFHALPGMVMLLIGSVEMLNAVPADVAAEKYSTLLEQIATAVPQLRALVVSTVPPILGDSPNLDAYNDQLRKPGGRWDEFETAHPSVTLVRVDIHEAMGGKFHQELFVDTHHPNDAGYAVMGQTYWAAMAPALDLLTRK